MKKWFFAEKTVVSLLKEAAEDRDGLKHTLGPMNFIAIEIGAIAGLFVMLELTCLAFVCSCRK